MKIGKTLALGLTCLLLTAATASAQTRFVQILTVHAKPDMAMDYEAFAKKVTAAFAKAGQNQRRLAFQVTAGGPGYTYMVATYFDKWAETDSFLSTPEILNKAMGEQEGGRALRVGRTSIESTQTEVFRLVPDLSTKPKVYDPPPAYLKVFRTEVKPEMTHEWEQLIRRYKAASEQVAEAPTAIRRVSVEGKGSVYLTSSPYMKGAERDAWPEFVDILKKVYGEDEARNLDARRRACIERSETFILKFRPDLSYMGK